MSKFNNSLIPSMLLLLLLVISFIPFSYYQSNLRTNDSSHNLEKRHSSSVILHDGALDTLISQDSRPAGD